MNSLVALVASFQQVLSYVRQNGRLGKMQLDQRSPGEIETEVQPLHRDGHQGDDHQNKRQESSRAPHPHEIEFAHVNCHGYAPVRSIAC
jgi:hypothetical protein